jgi:hypothetical protein
VKVVSCSIVQSLSNDMSNSPPVSPVSAVDYANSPAASVRSVSPALATPTPQFGSHLPQNASPAMSAARAQKAPQSQKSQQSTSPASSSAPGSAPAAGKSTNQPGIKLAKWGISLIQPICMTIFLLLGILLAAGHHLYYASLNGSTTGSASR